MTNPTNRNVMRAPMNERNEQVARYEGKSTASHATSKVLTSVSSAVEIVHTISIT